MSLSVPRAALAQAEAAPALTQQPSPSRSSTTDGLKQLLQDIRAAAKSSEMERMAAFLKETEIPNCEAWLHMMYKADSADSWMGLCDSKTLSSKEKSMQELFAQLAKDDGEFSTRKVNDNPEPGKGMEWGWLQAIRQPLDIYFASWKTIQGVKDSKPKPIGYFMFVDEGFRWDSGIEFVTPRISSSNVIRGKLIKSVAPIYPPDAIGQHISGTVRVFYSIGVDGVVYEAHAVSGEGLSSDPSLMKAAEYAVMQWRYEPSTFEGKPIRVNNVVANITFSPRS
jgi:hypothetical protein